MAYFSVFMIYGHKDRLFFLFFNTKLIYSENSMKIFMLTERSSKINIHSVQELRYFFIIEENNFRMKEITVKHIPFFIWFHLL